MNPPDAVVANQIADAVSAFQLQTTGHTSKSVAVVLNEDTLVINLHEALSPAEKALAKDADDRRDCQSFIGNCSLVPPHRCGRELIALRGRWCAKQLRKSTPVLPLSFTTFLLAPNTPLLACNKPETR
jgi:hypothetical protein